MKAISANLAFAVEERPNAMSELVSAVTALTERQQIRVQTNGVKPSYLCILLHSRVGAGKLATKVTGPHELLVWRRTATNHK